MDEYQVFFTHSARKELESLPTRLGERIVRRLESLVTSPRPPGCRKLAGTKNSWRLRVGDYRVIYTVDDTSRIVDVIAVRHRSDAYS